MNEKKVKVKKVDGSLEDFDKNKLIDSIVAAGASKRLAKQIANYVEKHAYDGIPTSEIRRMVLIKLNEKKPEAAEAWRFYDRIIKGRITFEDGKYVLVEKGKVYLGWQVKDMGPKGLSHSKEVEEILKEMDEDLKHGISRRTINARCYALFMGVLKSRKMSVEEKKKAIELINKWREKHGWKPYILKREIT